MKVRVKYLKNKIWTSGTTEIVSRFIEPKALQNNKLTCNTLNAQVMSRHSAGFKKNDNFLVTAILEKTPVSRSFFYIE